MGRSSAKKFLVAVCFNVNDKLGFVAQLAELQLNFIVNMLLWYTVQWHL